jgi:tRNA N6-adenosine threonylcarbamoyltransferase
MLDAGAAEGIRVLVPPLELCTDNAAMIACAGSARWSRGERSSLDIGADPNLRLGA